MISIRAKKTKDNKTAIRVKAFGLGKDLVEEAFMIITELPKVLADKDPILLGALDEMLKSAIEKDEEETDDGE